MQNDLLYGYTVTFAVDQRSDLTYEALVLPVGNTQHMVGDVGEGGKVGGGWGVAEMPE